MQVSVIIVNYNVKYFLEHCLYSVQQATKSLKAEVIVVDNASSDGSIEYLLEKFPSVNFIDNPKNLGFAKANNQALREAKGEYILFLNPDTIVSEDCVERCIQLLQSNPQLGACGVKMIDGSGRFLPESKRAFPSLQTSFYKLSGLTYLFPHSKRFARYHLGHLSEEKNNEIDVLSGAYFMSRREILNKAGGFDERFFMYGEDIDLSYRIQQEGYKNFYVAETCIIHYKGESTKRGSLNYVKIFYRAMSLFVEKHYKGKNSGTFNFFIETSIWFRAGLSVTKNIFSRKPELKDTNINTLIVAEKEEALKIESILNKNNDKRTISRSAPNEGWKQLVLLNTPDEIIFAYGTFSYKEIIHYMQELPKSITFSIYSGKAQSIVGSDSKKSNGYILA